jgi:hypothetical protein
VPSALQADSDDADEDSSFVESENEQDATSSSAASLSTYRRLLNEPKNIESKKIKNSLEKIEAEEKSQSAAEYKTEELKRVEALAKDILNMSKAVSNMERQQATKAEFDAVNRKSNEQLKDFELKKLRNDFEIALGRQDWNTAQSKMTTAGQLDKNFIRDWDVLITDAKNKAGFVANATPGIKTMPVPIMHEDLYKNVDTSKAVELNITKFDAVDAVSDAWDAQHKSFTLEYGEPV